MSAEKSPPVKEVEPYTVLAAGYDVVMDHVDYDGWAAYVFELIETFRPGARTLLELGCGTGSFALALQPRGGFDYVATDQSEAMLKVARTKAAEEEIPVAFRSADFTEFDSEEPVDVVILLYDGLNYLLEKENIRRMFRCVNRVLTEDGIFIVDQSTPANSANNARYFRDSGQVSDFAYERFSRYDPDSRRHTTRFDITVYGTTYREEHVQRAYTRDEVQALIQTAGFAIDGCFADMSRQAATEHAERIHWVLRKEAR